LFGVAVSFVLTLRRGRVMDHPRRGRVMDHPRWITRGAAAMDHPRWITRDGSPAMDHPRRGRDDRPR